MKWIALAIMVGMAAVLASMLRTNRMLVVLVAFLFGIAPFLLGAFHLSVSPIAWPAWPGPVKGTELTILDFLALAVVAALPNRHRIPWGLTAAFWFYVLVAVISVLVASVKMAAFFYVFQLMRSLIVFLATVRLCRIEERAPIAILTGGIAGLSIHAVVALVQFATGTIQAGGWMGHQNLLGMTAHFVVYPALALLLGGWYLKRSLVCLTAAFVIAFTGGSRGTIGLLAAGLLATGIISYLRRPQSRKAMYLAGGAVAMILAAPLLLSAVGRRSTAALEGSSQMRAQMIDAAHMMLADHPFGVGAVNYVVVANLGGYSARAGVPWNYSNRSAPIHNSYYLVLTEMGWLGLSALISFLVAAAAATWRAGRRATGYRAELSTGLFVTVCIVASHMYVEWIVMLSALHYQWAILLGVAIAGLRRSDGQGVVAGVPSAALEPEQ